MSKSRIVFRRDDGQWVNKVAGAERAGSIHGKQIEAVDAARTMLHRAEGGELIIKGRDGKIRSKDTIPSGKDTCPPRDGNNRITYD